MRTLDISNTASICGWAACKSKGTSYPEESVRHTPLWAHTCHQGSLICFIETMIIPDIEEAVPLGRPRPHSAHSWPFPTVVAVVNQGKVPRISSVYTSCMYQALVVHLTAGQTLL